MPEQQMSPEQVAELKEKIKNMNPEELREFQKKQCIFCHIVSGRVQSRKIYEDDKVLAILDINPANPGHMLLFPKEHYSIMPQIPEDILTHLFVVVKALSNAALRALGTKGANILVANGIAAGQKANHFMMHIIPRKEKDGLNFVLPQKTIDEKELISVREKLVRKIASLTGKKPDEPKKHQAVSIPMMPPQKAVEAKFEEPKKEKITLPKPAKAGRPVKISKPAKAGKAVSKQAKAGNKTKQKKEGDVSLDDIAGLFKK